MNVLECNDEPKLPDYKKKRNGKKLRSGKRVRGAEQSPVSGIVIKRVSKSVAVAAEETTADEQKSGDIDSKYVILHFTYILRSDILTQNFQISYYKVVYQVFCK